MHDDQLPADASPQQILEFAQHIFDRAPFIERLGCQIERADATGVIARMRLQPWMLQATGVGHAGVVTALGDHTAACAARIAMRGQDTLVSIQLETRLMRPAVGTHLEAHGRLIKPGRRVSFAVADIYAVSADGQKKQCASFSVTLTSAPAAR